MTERRRQAQLFSSARWRAGSAAIGLAVLVLLGAAALYARSSHGRPFAGLLTDPSGTVSPVRWPGWEPAPPHLQSRDRLIAIEGESIVHGAPDGVADRIAIRMANLYRSGRRKISLTLQTAGGVTTITRSMGTLGTEEWLFFFAIYALIGLFVLWSGVMVIAVAWRRPGAVTYGWWGAGTFVFLTCFYDYHTTAKLVPLFGISTVWIQICVIRLAYFFPAPPIQHRRALRAGVRVLTAAGVVAAGALLIGPHAGLDVTPLRMGIARSALGSLLVLPTAFALRWWVEPLGSRRRLGAAEWRIAAVVPVLAACGFILAAHAGIGIVHTLLPVLALLVPLSIGYALIRNDLRRSSGLFTRRILLIPIVNGAAVVAILVWFGVHALLRHHDLSAVFPWGPSLATLIVLSGLGHRLGNRIFVPARTKLRPSIQQLVDDLAAKRDAQAIERSIAESVVRWLPTDRARVVRADELHQIPRFSEGYRESLGAGRAIWTSEPLLRRQLLLPMRSHGKLRAVLVLGPKCRKAPYTREDLDLLETVASLGALALHNADAITEREDLRRLEIEAARDDKRLTLGLLGAEIAHEIAYPLNFLRYLFGQRSAGHALDARDVEIAREEIGRLERMFSGLRKLRIPLPRPEPVQVLPRARRALDLIREIILAKELEVTVDLPPDLIVFAEPDPLVQIFANLLRNAAQAVAPKEQIGIGWLPTRGGIAIEVWDSGPGPSEELQDRLFNPFVTDKEGSMGLGLAVTARLVGSFAWTISVLRREARTVFRIDVPDESGHAPEEPPS